ncbi:tetratricopeptide repeat protein [Prosthecomicrobium pneumaticum]|uniref:Tetratricopeptide (TPR) repeat protein n=1 Tax=Prosthecomicrobium pneumaticum TaxID=81895 RepID=A0A7W9CUU3_9HYPH|nr:tetratricopeptide repeat protein [Prosthecomicrobium pneumaticum]MBB5751968.1 tetratricopeptide (TPR) repeat protein [Prosthecomicrobium pneumaticum]
MKRKAVAALRLAGLLAALPLAPLAAQATARTVDDYGVSTPTGAYLAGMSAMTAGDNQAAAAFFEAALDQDPDNPALLQQTFMLKLSAGDVEGAVPLARQLVGLDTGDGFAELVLGCQALKAGDFAGASRNFVDGNGGALANITSGLLAAWAAEGRGETDAALKIVDTLQGPSWYGVFKTFHAALIAEHAGRIDEARRLFEKSYAADPSPLRVVEAYVRFEARHGGRDKALKALADFRNSAVTHPTTSALEAEIGRGGRPAALLRDPAAGAAEALYGLGSALGTDSGGQQFATVYLQLALYLAPGNELALMALGDLYQTLQRQEPAIAIFDRIPAGSPLRRSADIQVALSLDALDRPQEAVARLETLTAADPRDVEAWAAIGQIQRGRKAFAQSAEAYSKAIAALPAGARNWSLHYARGIAYERTKRWAEAEADFLKALSIQPEQPQVLNYLGYSWIDRGINIERGTALIKKAVELRPDDGYIVDSLGWAYYKTGHYDEAVAQLERAVELRSDDPTINDHLGDAYWKTGRKLEATFQWRHARDLGPEPEDLTRIEAKLEKGLDRAEETKVAAIAPTTSTDAGDKPATVSEVTVGAGDTLWTIAERVYGDGHLYRKLLEANRAVIVDPNRLPAGLTLTVPPAGAQR